MTISQQIAKSLRTGSRASNEKEDDEDLFDLDELLQSASQKVLLERVNFVPAKFPYHFNLKQLKSKYIILNHRQGESSSNSTSTMSPALNAGTTSAANASLEDGIPTPKMILFSAERVEQTWRNAMRVGAGLFNLGNTCFLNSSLQCLTYTAPLANYLIHLDHQRNCRSNGQFCMLCAMQQHLKNSRSHPGQSIKPMYILQNLRMIAKHLQFGRQEDAHEFIRYCVDAMQRACLVGYPSKLDVHVKATTAVHQIFGGYLRSRVRCTQCKSVSDTFDPFLDLSLEINKQGCGSLQHCLEMFVRAEILQGDNAYKCMRCKNAVTAFKKFSVHRAPNILMLQLKRFSNFLGSKINKNLSYPSKLNLAPYMSHKQVGELWYELYAVLVHSGFSCQSGHYYSYAKAPNGQWYCFNDSSVYQVGVNQALNQQAYLLFYSRSHKGQNLHLKNGHNVTVNGNGKMLDQVAEVTRSNKETTGKSNNLIIGPQLPPELKRKKDHPSPSSSDKAESSPKRFKQSIENHPKKILNGSNDRVSFVLNRKPKLIVESPSKLVNKAKPMGSGNKLQSPGVNRQVKSLPQEKPSNSQPDVKAKTETATISKERPSILNQLLHDSKPNGNALISQKKTTSALQALNAYSSSDSDSDNEDDNEKKSGYSTLTSTLATLRKSEPNKSHESKEDKSEGCSNVKRQDFKTGKSNGLNKATPQKALNLNNSSNSNRLNSQREPILQVLSSEMKCNSLKTQTKDESLSLNGNKDKNELKKCSTPTNNVTKGSNRKRHHSDESQSMSRKICKISSKSLTEIGKSENAGNRRHSSDHDGEQMKELPTKKNTHNSALQKGHSKERNNCTNQQIDKLYCDKKEYEQSMRKKAKKERKQRMENLQVLQNCIDKDDGGDKNTQGNTGTQGKKTHSNPADRPNVLGQLLKQSSEKAYGVKVDSWDGAVSAVESDARSTWKQLQAPLLDDWNREYDKGKVKKVKKENRMKNQHSSANIFQKFQNLKNEKKF